MRALSSAAVAGGEGGKPVCATEAGHCAAECEGDGVIAWILGCGVEGKAGQMVR